MKYQIKKVISSVQNSHFAGSGRGDLVGTLTPFFGEDEILVQGTKKRVMGTKSNTLSPNI